VFTDRAIACVDCGQEFTFTAGEQEFYEQRGFTEAPKRCGACRAIRKAQRQSAGFENGGGHGAGTSGYSSDGGYGTRGGYGSNDGYAGTRGYGSGGYGERREREMFDAVCADCGKTARVPFRPSGARPVYCSDCFQTRR
jgi:CxxC-x17-CxxC domain-containing protein